MAMDIHQQEIDANFDYLQRNLSTMLREHEGKYALLKSCRVEGYYDKPGTAYDEGIRRFSDGIFSIQEVTGEPLHLGFWSIAGD